MNCREFVDFLMEYLDGRLDASQAAVFQEHMRECPPCEVYLDTYQETIREWTTAGYLKTETLPSGAKWRYDYDAKDNLIQITDPKGRTVRYDYDSKSRPIRVRDQNGVRSEQIYDKDGRLRALTRLRDGVEQDFYYATEANDFTLRFQRHVTDFIQRRADVLLAD